ncbi:MAG: YbfB/YjiJ family MFS transporter [Rhizobiaceae bacterium]|nr:YbfB/YjiJ family MFS transporter [Rhizobiaceae bacterium]
MPQAVPGWYGQDARRRIWVELTRPAGFAAGPACPMHHIGPAPTSLRTISPSSKQNRFHLTMNRSSTPMRPAAKITLLAAGPALGISIARFAYGLLLPAMKDEFGWSYSEAGWINTSNAVGYILGALTASIAVRRLGAAVTYGAGAAVTVLALFCLGHSDDFIVLNMLRLVSGVSGAWIFVAGGVIATAVASEQPESSAVLIGIFYAGAGFGIVLSGALVPPWLDLFGQAAWREAWLLLGALGFLLAAMGCLAAKAAADGRPMSVGGGAYRIARDRWILGGYAAFGAGSMGYMTFVVSYLASRAVGHAQISAFWIVIGLSSMSAPWLWSRLLSRQRHARAFAVLVSVCGIGSVIPLFSTNVPAVMISAAVFGSAFFAVVAATTDFVRRNVEPDGRATAVGAFTVAFGVGQMVGPFAVGAVADSHSSLIAGLAASSLLIALGATLSLPQRDRRS